MANKKCESCGKEYDPGVQARHDAKRCLACANIWHREYKREFAGARKLFNTTDCKIASTFAKPAANAYLLGQVLKSKRQHLKNTEEGKKEIEAKEQEILDKTVAEFTKSNISRNISPENAAILAGVECKRIKRKLRNKQRKIAQIAQLAKILVRMI